MTTALTGTPGVGKTTVSRILKERGYQILDLNGYIEEKGLAGDHDPVRDTREVDMEELSRYFEREDKIWDIVEGHLSHTIITERVIVLRCSPQILEKRMVSKGWHKEKVRENMMAEILDVILIEAMESTDEVYEINTTKMTPKEVADIVELILRGENHGHGPGGVDWTEYLE